MTLHQMTAVQAADAIRQGDITSEQLVRSCLDRIGEFEETVQAWTYLDPEYALRQAKQADLARKSGFPLGPLHGVPVGIKDIFDTQDMPTEDGTVLHAGRQPTEDCTVVALLRQAGAVIMGKTVTTELAVYSPGKTKNPHNPEHTPGGSSSGSAAAVASFMVPLAVGSQTNGSMIRPASYCGVVGYKPSHGLVSRHGVLRQSPPLDTIGVFGRTVGDVALIAQVLMAYDSNDKAMRPSARPTLLETAAAEPPVDPDFAFVKSPVWDQADEDLRGAFEELAEHLGERVEEVTLSETFDYAHGWQKTIMLADLAKNFMVDELKGRDKISKVLCEMLDEGKEYKAVAYNEAVEHIDVLNNLLAEVFEKFNAIITPATTGEAPKGLDATGSPTFCTLWTYCGMPAVTIPVMQGSNGLPVGVQIVGPKGDDARVLQCARWLMESLAPEDLAEENMAEE
ncbi:MAG: amidase [Rhodospirillales bacterium]|jgi:Asp-tRNA(Asn)/Glu-tRNA(Gln) amidotransferase A subunit family amidase|nr:amidase [Rhodospirillales bacterium]